jgi:hypothetical protein
MAEIKIIDDILAPREFIRIGFKGENPFKVCEMVKGLLRIVLKVSTKDIFETDVRWDVTEDPRSFYGVWKGNYDHDRWTNSIIRIIIQGEQSVKDKTGHSTIILKGTTETKFEYSNFIQRSFWWFYNQMFYYRQRRMYNEYAKDLIYIIRDKILEALEIKQED